MPVTSRELQVVLIVCVLGAVLRLAFPHHLGIEHFDEGVYASNLWFDASSAFRYPMRHLYAPPLLPAAIEGSLILNGVNQFSPFLPSLLAGVALVPSVWWIGRQWFGPAAGVAAMSLAALSDVHAVFSRMALTDALLVLALAWGVYGAGETVRRGGGKMLVLAVAAAAAAWWTKYNGWLALAIPIASVVLFWLLNAPARQQWRSSVGWLAIISITTGLLWAPVLWELQRFGGYGPVAANHARYLTGVAEWPFAALQQLANLRQLESTTLAVLAPLVAFAIGGVVCHRPHGASAPAARRDRSWAILVGMAAAWSLTSCLAGSGLALGGAALGMIATTLMRTRPTTRPASLPMCLLMVWFVGLLFATPLYHPYARLTLPWLVSAWLGAGWAVSQCWRQVTDRPDESSTSLPSATPSPTQADVRFWWCLPVAGVLASIALGPRPIDLSPVACAWQSHSTTHEAATRMVVKLQLTTTAQSEVVLVYGEPALFYELCAAGVPNVAPLGDIRMVSQIAAEARTPVWVALGPHAEHDEAVQEWLNALPANTPIEKFAFRPSTAVLLDRFSPAELRERAPNQTERFLLVPLP